MDIETLLPEKWRSIRHVETERHWYIAAYAIVIAGVLSFLGQSSQSNWSFILGYLGLTVVGIIGLVHALQSAWILFLLQNDLNRIGNIAGGEIGRFWRFNDGPARGRGTLQRDRKWFESVFLSRVPKGIIGEQDPPMGFTFTRFNTIHAWSYSLAIVFFGLSFEIEFIKLLVD